MLPSSRSQQICSIRCTPRHLRHTLRGYERPRTLLAALQPLGQLPRQLDLQDQRWGWGGTSGPTLQQSDSLFIIVPQDAASCAPISDLPSFSQCFYSASVWVVLGKDKALAAVHLHQRSDKKSKAKVSPSICQIKSAQESGAESFPRAMTRCCVIV